MSHTLHEIYAGTANPASPVVDEQNARALLADFQAKGIISHDQLEKIGTGKFGNQFEVGPIHWQISGNPNLRAQIIRVAKELTQKPAENRTFLPK